MLLSYLAQRGERRRTGIRENNIELALLPLDSREEAIKVAKVRHVSLDAGYIFPISFTAAANSASRRPVMKT